MMLEPCGCKVWEVTHKPSKNVRVKVSHGKIRYVRVKYILTEDELKRVRLQQLMNAFKELQTKGIVIT